MDMRPSEPPLSAADKAALILLQAELESKRLKAERRRTLLGLRTMSSFVVVVLALIVVGVVVMLFLMTLAFIESLPF